MKAHNFHGPYFLILFTLSFVVFGNAGALSENARTVRVGVYQNEPKVFMDDTGAARGIFPDLLNEISEIEGWKLVFVPGTWENGLDWLGESRIDLMPDVCYTDERSRIYRLNSEPVLSDWFGVYTLPERGFSSILDLSGKKVALLKKSVQEIMFRQMVNGFGLDVEMILLDDYDKAATHVRDSRADAMVSNRYACRLLSEKYGLRETAVIFNPTKLHFAAPRESDGLVLEAIDTHVSKWKADPESVYYRILKKYTGETPLVSLPPWVRNTLVAGFLAVALFGGVALLLKWQVSIRTSDLRRRTAELEKALDLLKAANEKALQQERLHALGQMAGGLAHDFNNVLMAVTGWAELLLRDPEVLEDKKSVREHVGVILDAARDGAGIVGRMRDFYRHRAEERHCVMVHPGRVVEKVVELTHPRWLKPNQSSEICIRTQIKDTPPIFIDETELREALVNLIFNSVDAMPDGGTILIEVSAEKDISVKIRVSDTGLGMTPEVLAHCFNAFYTTKGNTGTGMGLPMVKDFCDRYGGSVEIESHPGTGTEVCLAFPAMWERADENEPAGEIRRRIRPLKIMAVDDEPRALEVLQALLSCEGHSVDACLVPKEIPARLSGGMYDLVVTDWDMPEMSGIQLAKRISEIYPAMPVIILTGLQGDDTEFNSGGIRPSPILRKPLQRLELLRVLDELGFGVPGRS